MPLWITDYSLRNGFIKKVLKHVHLFKKKFTFIFLGHYSEFKIYFIYKKIVKSSSTYFYIWDVPYFNITLFWCGRSVNKKDIITYLKYLFKKSSRRCFTHLLFYVPKILSNGFCSQKKKIAICQQTKLPCVLREGPNK